MRFAAFQHEGYRWLAADADSGWHGVRESEAAYPGDLMSLLTDDADFAQIAETILQGERIDIDELTLLPPIEHPGKIVCVGLNYKDHAQETGLAVATCPTVFARYASSLIGHGTSIIRPKQSSQLDFEGELAAIIGKSGRHIPLEEALDHVAGYSIFNDATLRDFQFLTTQWTFGKNFDATGAFGPCFVTAASLPPGCQGLRLVTRLCGQVVQDANVSEMIFPVGELVARISEVMTLSPGDVIVTGTPAGVGMSREPKLWMKAGDVCEVEIERIGILRSSVIDEIPGSDVASLP